MEEKIEKLITKMTKNDLLELKTRIDLLLQLSQEHDKDLKSDSDISLLYRSLIGRVALITGNALPPLHVLKTRNEKVHKRIRDLKTFLNMWLWSILDYEPSRMQKVQLYLMYAKLTSKFLNAIPGAPITLRSLLNCKDRFPDVFENSFPGYIEAGLGKAVFESPASYKKEPG